jgi:hypothetical protein
MKRLVPFFLTFAVGLFIASFFVTVAAPSFSFPNRGWRNSHREYDRQREVEIRQLREENSRLKQELEEQKIKNQSTVTFEWRKSDLDAPPPPPVAPTMPMKPVPYKGR